MIRIFLFRKYPTKKDIQAALVTQCVNRASGREQQKMSCSRGYGKTWWAKNDKAA